MKVKTSKNAQSAFQESAVALQTKEKGDLNECSHPISAHDGSILNTLDMEEPPQDRYNVAYIIFFFQGLGIFFPWNMFITGNAYYRLRLEGTSFVTSFDNYQTFSYQLCNLFLLLFAIRYQHLMNISTRVVAPLLIQLVLFISTTAVVYIEMSSEIFFVILILTSCLSGAALSFPLCGLFGLAHSMPKRYVQALMAGEGLGGVLVALISLVSVVVTDDEKDKTRYLIYFLMAVLIILVCVVSYLVLIRLPIVCYYRRIYEQSTFSYRQTKATKSSHFSYSSVFSKLLYPCSLLYLNFLITLSAFPTVTVMIEPTLGNKDSNKFFGELWLPVYCFLLFNVFDYLGRSLSAWFTFPGLKNMWILILGRASFIVFFMFCNIPASGFSFFTGETWPIIFMILFSFSNGYCASVTMIASSELVSGEELDVTGAFTVFSIEFGVASGCLLAFGWKAIICSCNSFLL
eukprot:Sdes_comp19602_c0_seq2m11337